MVSVCLVIRHCFCFCSFQGYLYSELPWKIEVVSPFGAKGRHAYHLNFERFGFSRLWVPFLMQSIAYVGITWPTLCFTVGSGTGELHKKMLIF